MATEFARSQTTELSCVGLMLGCYQKYTSIPPNIAELKTALLSIWNNLPQQFIDRGVYPYLPMATNAPWSIMGEMNKKFNIKL